MEAEVVEEEARWMVSGRCPIIQPARIRRCRSARTTARAIRTPSGVMCRTGLFLLASVGIFGVLFSILLIFSGFYGFVEKLNLENIFSHFKFWRKNFDELKSKILV